MSQFAKKLTLDVKKQAASQSKAWQRLLWYRWYQAEISKVNTMLRIMSMVGQVRHSWQRLWRRMAVAASIFALASGMTLTSWFAPAELMAAPDVPVTVTTLTDELSASNNAACSLREAIQLANGDLTDRGCGTTAATSITVPAGTLTLSLTGTENDGFLQGANFNNSFNDLDILSGTTLTITGNGSGSTFIQAGTTADDGTGTVGNGIDRVFHVIGNLTLNDVTVRNGLVFSDNLGQGLGGGIDVRGGTLVINDSIITGNTARGNGLQDYDGWGGGINNANGTVTLNNTNLTNNNVTSGGGGAANWGTGSSNVGRMTITNGQITGNSANQGAGIVEVSYDSANGYLDIDGTTISSNSSSDGFGGAISVNPGNTGVSTVTITNATINGNSALQGGGVSISGGSATVTVNNSMITNNNTTNGPGGGIKLSNNQLTVTNSTISGNNAVGTSAHGGGIHGSGTLNVTDTTITNNSGVYGGAMFITAASGQATVVNTTISGNSNTDTAYGSGGVYSSGGANINLVNTTITGNTTAGAGGGNGLYLYGGATITLKNSIVTNNQNSECSTMTGLSGNNNLVDDATCTGNLGTVTNFNSSLASNGGDTQTHAITTQSNAVDAGNTTDCSTFSVTQDQRNIINRGTCDVGAFEIGDLTCGIQAGAEPNAYPFFTNLQLNVTNDGSNLECLWVQETPTNHPNASVANLQTGTYWSIEGLQSDRSTTATSDFTLDMTLPHSVSPDSDANVCRHVSGTTWDCGRNSSTGSTVTRTGITSLSEWTVGNSVGPTAVRLQSQDAQNTSSRWGTLVTTFLALLGLSGLVWRKRPID